jgi:periplasmic protein TonB
MAAYVHDSQFFTRRTFVVFAILGLHVFIAWALATGLARKAIEVLAPPIQTVIETETHKEAPPPPPPPPTFERPPVEIPPTDTIVEIPTPVQTTAITNTTTAHVAAAAPAPKVGVHHNANLDPKHLLDTEQFYPSASRRLGEEGVAQVHVCINASGKLAGAPAVEKSAGSSRLDDGAISYAKAARYVPGTDDGKPLDNSCFSYNVRFKLN